MSERSSIFDMLGPVMIGPSSSHTAGVARVGRTAYRLLNEIPHRVRITFYNSFAATYEGHGSDRAIIGGLLGMKPDDERLRHALELSAEAGLGYHFKAVHHASELHPNSIRVVAEGPTRQVELLGVSRGGGLISIVELDGFPTNFTAQATTLIVTAKDKPGNLAFVSNVVQYDDCNIATMTVNRRGKHSLAKLVFEVDSPVTQATRDYIISREWVEEVLYLEKESPKTDEAP